MPAQKEMTSAGRGQPPVRAMNIQRQVLRGGVSLLPLIACWLAPHPAFAACPISTAVAGPVAVSSNCSITSLGQISGSSTGIQSTGSYGSLGNSGTIVGYDNGINNGATLGTLNNSGFVAGIYYGSGLDNQGSIGALSNLTGASFTGAYYGISNHGGITSLSNNGVISSQSGFDGHSMAAVFNGGAGNIGTLTNIGTIVSGATTAFDNAGLITSLANSGSVLGDLEGLWNSGTITAFDNSGSINGAVDSGIYNTGLLSTFTNTGTVTGALAGVDNTGTISNFDNGTGGLLSGVTAGLNNGGYIGSLTNEGTITGTSPGSYGIINSGTIGAFGNSGAVSGELAGLINSGTIADLNNSSTGVFSGITGLVNDTTGSIGTLTNDGQLSGNSFGFTNHGLVDGFTNSASGLVSANATALKNSGTILSLVNIGSISGEQGGITNSGSIGSIDNQGAVQATSIGFGMDNAGTIGSVTNAANASFTGFYAGIYNEGKLTSLTNHGLISGFYTGVANQNTIGTLINTGTIIGTTSDGIYNGGSIGGLSNSGTISGATVGVYNDGTIGALGNSGTIFGGSSFGLLNYEGSYIGSIDNSGIITGGSIALENWGTIGSLINEAGGTIYGVTAGLIVDMSVSSSITTAGSIELIDNEGLISGGSFGFGNAGFVNTLDNSGTIVGTSGFGAYNVNTIDTFSNTGSIIGNGAFGLFNQGTIGTLDNAGGALIKGAEFGLINVYGVGSVSNEGVIHGTYTGMYNVGDIGALTNSGQIIGQNGIGVANYATLGSFANLTGATISGGGIGLLNTGEIDAPFTNGGSISAHNSGTTGTLSAYALDNQGTILTLANSGSITAAATVTSGTGTLDVVGLFNSGSIAGVFNTGNIAASDSIVSGSAVGGAAGVENQGGSIGYFHNSGLISVAAAAGTDGFAFDNNGTIGALDNAAGGTITGGSAALYNAGDIGSLSNEGVIADGDGIANGGSIGNFSNTGSISGDDGVYNEGTIGALQNSGIITGGTIGIVNSGSNASIGSIDNTGTIAGSRVGIANSGSIAQITNEGVISGVTGLDLSSGSATLINTGTIIGTGGTAILIGGNDDLIFGTGSDLVGVINGLTTTNAISLTGTGTLDSDIVNFATGSALDVVHGADWAAEGHWGLDLVTNDGIFRPGMQNGSIGAPLTITGNFAQGPDGTLMIEVTPNKSSGMEVTGSTELDGNITYEFAPGIYHTHTYEVITTGTLNGSFAAETYNVAGVPSGITVSTVYLVDPGVDLVLTAPAVVAVPDAALFSAQRQALAEDTQSDNDTLLNQALNGGNGGGAAGACANTGAAAQSGAGNGGEVGRLTAELANGFCAAGGWVVATGDLFNAGASNGAAGYNANTAGFLAGIDKQVGEAGTRLGFAVGYGSTSLNERGGGSASTGVVRLAFYGAQPIGRVTLSGVIDYGHASGSLSRAADISTFKSHADAGIFGAGLQASTRIELGRLVLTPEAGLRIASVSGGRFGESTSADLAPYAVSGEAPGYVSTQPYLTLQMDHQYTTESNLAVGTQAKLGWQYEASDTGVYTNTVTDDGTVLASARNHLAPNAAVLGASVTIGRNNWALYASYSAHIAGNWNSQTGAFGVQVKF